MIKYATGCAFNIKHLFYNFNTKILSVSSAICKKLISDNHKKKLAERIFKYALSVIIDDIIDNNVTFILPTLNKKSSIYMKRYVDEQFAKGRRNGKWKDVDILSSNFSGYQLMFKYYQGLIEKERPIYVDKNRKDRITRYTNQGKQYY